MCSMFVPKPNLYASPQTYKLLRKRREHAAAAAKQARAKLVWFYVNGNKIDQVTTVCYLGRLLAEDDDKTVCIRA